MPVCIKNVPEPENKPDEVESPKIDGIQVLELGSDEDNEEGNIMEEPGMQGYQPLPAAEHFSLSSDEEEDVHSSESSDHQRDLKVDLDLVRNAMQNVKLDISKIPLWAKDISDSAWNEVVQQTINGKEKHQTTENNPSSSQQSQNPT